MAGLVPCGRRFRLSEGLKVWTNENGGHIFPSEYLVLVGGGEVEAQEGEAGHQEVTQGGGQQQ